MVSLSLLCLSLCVVLSPMKMAFMVTLFSITISLHSYTLSNSVFTSCVMVISFSSGMMILFCYCSMLSNYESKILEKTTPMVLIPCLMLFMSTSPNTTMQNSVTENSFYLTNNQTLLLTMSVVLMAMVFINKCLMDPSKTLMQSL
nr:NADH dehydrogenase subunit 6 [Lardoglyphus konoi]